MRASSAKTLREDLLTAALDLKSELLLSESSVTGETGKLLYSSGTGLGYLLDLLKVWLRTPRAAQSKVLIVLDDLDGLEASELSELSDLVSGDHVDVIYSTRDPTIADQTSYMYAANFDVPPLEPQDAQDLFQQLGNQHSGTRTSEPEMISKLITGIGHLPAAIVNANHYFKDNLGSANPYTLSTFLAEWQGSEAVKGGLLQFRRRTFIYPHTMQASFEVSLSRLKRSLISEKPGFYTCSLYLLHLLGIMDVNKFARSEMESLCALLKIFVDTEKIDNEILRQLSSDASVAYRCVTELAQVSLLSDPDGSGFLLLNNLTKACVWLTVTQDMGETAPFGGLLERAAKFLARSWIPCLRPYDLSKTGEAEVATSSEAPSPSSLLLPYT